MSLLKHLAKGAKLIGLRDRLNVNGLSPADNAGEVSHGVIDGSYDYEWNAFTANTITFHGDRSGQFRVKILPYFCGGINFCTVGGEEIISGPFTGCYMSLYSDPGGSTRCGHVDTAVDDEAKVKHSEVAWRALNRPILAERKSTVSQKMSDNAFKAKAADAFLVGVATPAPAAISFFRVFKMGSDFIVQSGAE
jgi:hypothetical protein